MSANVQWENDTPQPQLASSCRFTIQARSAVSPEWNNALEGLKTVKNLYPNPECVINVKNVGFSSREYVLGQPLGLLKGKVMSGLKNRIAVVSLVLSALSVSSVSAATVYYNNLNSGDDLGIGSQATLEYNQSGSDVTFALTNTANSVSTAFLAGVGFFYNGSAPTLWEYTTGTTPAAGIEGFGLQGLAGGGVNLTFGVQIENSGNPTANRLVVNETLFFTLKNVTASLFDFTEDKTQVHIQGLSNDGSTKYTTGGGGGGTGPTPVPLPASLPLMLIGLSGLAFMRGRRARKSI